MDTATLPTIDIVADLAWLSGSCACGHSLRLSKVINFLMGEGNKHANTRQEFIEDDDDSGVEYVDPAELSPIGNEELFAAEINTMVAEDAPRVFALCEEIGQRADAVTIAWGMAFNGHAELVSAAHNGVRGVFGSAERARKWFSVHGKTTVRLVWVDQTQEQITRLGSSPV